jgi:hypothetical protein
MSTSDAVVPESRVRSEVYGAVAEFARPQARTAIGQISLSKQSFSGRRPASSLSTSALRRSPPISGRNRSST